MECVALHVDLIDSRRVLQRVRPIEERRRFSACCLHVLELLATQFLQEEGAGVSWAGDGGFCLVPLGNEPTRQIRRLWQVAVVYPTYIRNTAKEPILEAPPKQKLNFRRGISWIRDVPSGPIQGAIVGSLELASAIKKERMWCSAEASFIAVWPEVFNHLSPDTFIAPEKAREVSAEIDHPRYVYDLEPQVALEHLANLNSDISARLIRLEEATIHALQKCRNGKTLRELTYGDALATVFEPNRYLRETLAMLGDLIQRNLLSGKPMRVALFVPESHHLKLIASAAEGMHSTEHKLPQDGKSTSAVAFRRGNCCVVPNTSSSPTGNAESTFEYFSPEQRDTIKSILCFPILESRLRDAGGVGGLPIREPDRWGKPLAVVSLDSSIPNAFLPFLRERSRDALISSIQPILRDLEVGLLMREISSITKRPDFEEPK